MDQRYVKRTVLPVLLVIGLSLIMIIVGPSITVTMSPLYTDIKDKPEGSLSDRVPQKQTKVNTLKQLKRNPLFLRPLKTRHELPAYIQSLPNMDIGAEIGVQAGLYAKEMLIKWTKCRKYVLVDLWAKLKNYGGEAGKFNEVQQLSFMDRARENLAPWKNITEFVKGRSDKVVNNYRDETFDFVYVDARHDYCGVKVDLENWWAKVRQGGILAGHDYMHSSEVAGLDWTTCEDGSNEPGSVLRAVNEFAEERDLIVSVMYRERGSNSYMIRKPYV